MLKRLLFMAILIAAGFHKNLPAQAGFYDVQQIREIKLYFDTPDWDHILDSLFVAGSNGRLVADIEIDGTYLKDVGVRYKGFSSVSVNRVKNPFNISLDYLLPNQNYLGINKLKLGNVIQDPSFIREVLSYEIARKYMPASQANYAKVYINDVLWGLYSNVEAVNKDFAKNHFGSKQNAFFKCNPANLNLFGENANLSNSPGTDTVNYYSLYDMESDYGWSQLYELIHTLNVTPDSIESILNVDRTLWMHAFNYALVNFDSYIGYAQNYYLYREDNGQFSPVLWDLNMSFASFRFADASDFWDGFSINEAKTIDPLSHYNSVSVFPRPLMRNLFNNDTYRRMYLAHLRTIMEENFNNQAYFQRAQALQTIIDSEVSLDPNKFYSYADFQANLNNTVSDLIDYPGITELMDARSAYLNNYPGIQGAPVISNIGNLPLRPVQGESVTFRATISGATQVILAYRTGDRALFTKVNMLDDGSQNDSLAGDGIYGFLLTDVPPTIQYYLYAENDSSGRFSPARAAYEYHTIEPLLKSGELVINEILVQNQSTRDPADRYSPWIELYNNTSWPLNLGGLTLSHTQGFSSGYPPNLSGEANSETLPATTTWTLPDTTVPAGAYLLIWADADTFQSGLHCNFELTPEAGILHLGYANPNNPQPNPGPGNPGLISLDSLSFQNQSPDLSLGRYPNGFGTFNQLRPTFSAANSHLYEAFQTDDLFLFPNPVNDQLYIKTNRETPFQLDLVSSEGKTLLSQEIRTDSDPVQINTSQLNPGIYLIRVFSDTYESTRKFIVLH